MAFGGFDNSRRSGPMADINVVPLVDVMLVLLVIFIITAPLLTNAVKIDLPKRVTAAQSVSVAVEYGYWRLRSSSGISGRMRFTSRSGV